MRSATPSRARTASGVIAERRGAEERSEGRRPDPKWVMALLLAYLHHYRRHCNIRISLPSAHCNIRMSSPRAEGQWTRRRSDHLHLDLHHREQPSRHIRLRYRINLLTSRLLLEMTHRGRCPLSFRD